MSLATHLALTDEALNEAIASYFWQIPASSRDAPWFHHPDYCHNWFEAAKIVSHISLNGSPTLQAAFNAALHQLTSPDARPADILLICGPREICAAAMTAWDYAEKCAASSNIIGS
ncbi:hypothetical protein [Aquitalea sp. ASV11]|uniref:hypothetical protein n=1 Tax=Aquitalea sp. ASV11 TaxID=2795103 RepID=UPI0018ED2DCF|nr:hypothetical protein [Aquitalea sp. ASV11]